MERNVKNTPLCLQMSFHSFLSLRSDKLLGIRMSAKHLNSKCTYKGEVEVRGLRENRQKNRGSEEGG